MVRPVALLAFVVLALVAPAATASTAVDGISAEEQWFVYELNRARSDPAGWGAENGVRITSPAMPPLAINPSLTASTDYKAEEMLTEGRCRHRSTSTGAWPNELVISFGFPLVDWWETTANYVEALWCSNGHKDPVSPTVFLGSNSTSHIAQLLGRGDWHQAHEIGIGIARGGSGVTVAVHTGIREPSLVFVTGVVFRDKDCDQIMDLGEGLPRLPVTIGSRTILTNDGGGYSLSVSPGTYRVSAPGATAQVVTVASENITADFAWDPSYPWWPVAACS